MRKIVSTIAVLSFVVGGATAVGAAELALPRLAGPTVALSPPEGPPGTVLTVSGDGCDFGPGATIEVDTTASTNASTTPEAATVTPAPDGTWSVDLTVDADSVPFQSVVVDARCAGETAQPLAQSARRAPTIAAFDYDRAWFEVLPDEAMTLAPMSGPAGSEFTVSGGTCHELYDSTVEVTDGTSDETVLPDTVGDWDATFTVPDDAEVGDEITVLASCEGLGAPAFRSIRRGARQNSFDYTPVVFTVTDVETPAPSPSTPTPTDGAVAANAATATVAQPTFTG